MNDLAFSLASSGACRENSNVEVAAWRGSMLGHFAEVELAIGQTLLAAGCSGKELHLLGPKLSKLEELVSEGGCFELVGTQVRRELAAFCKYNYVRPALSHGKLRVDADEHGDWTARFDWLDFGATETTPCVLALTRLAALTMCDMLDARARHLARQLSQMRGKLGQSTYCNQRIAASKYAC